MGLLTEGVDDDDGGGTVGDGLDFVSEGSRILDGRMSTTVTVVWVGGVFVVPVSRKRVWDFYLIGASDGDDTVVGSCDDPSDPLVGRDGWCRTRVYLVTPPGLPSGRVGPWWGKSWVCTVDPRTRKVMTTVDT